MRNSATRSLLSAGKTQVFNIRLDFLCDFLCFLRSVICYWYSTEVWNVHFVGHQPHRASLYAQDAETFYFIQLGQPLFAVQFVMLLLPYRLPVYRFILFFFTVSVFRSLLSSWNELDKFCLRILFFFFRRKIGSFSCFMCKTGTEMAQLVCGGCHTLLMYIRGATSVQCSCCHTVNLALEGTEI